MRARSWTPVLFAAMNGLERRLVGDAMAPSVRLLFGPLMGALLLMPAAASASGLGQLREGTLEGVDFLPGLGGGLSASAVGLASPSGLAAGFELGLHALLYDAGCGDAEVMGHRGQQGRRDRVRRWLEKPDGEGDQGAPAAEPSPCRTFDHPEWGVGVLASFGLPGPLGSLRLNAHGFGWGLFTFGASADLLFHQGATFGFGLGPEVVLQLRRREARRPTLLFSLRAAAVLHNHEQHDHRLVLAAGAVF